MQLSVAAGILRDIGRNGGDIDDWNGLQIGNYPQLQETGGTLDEMAETEAIGQDLELEISDWTGFRINSQQGQLEGDEQLSEESVHPAI